MKKNIKKNHKYGQSNELISRAPLKAEIHKTVLEVVDTPLPNDYASKLAVKMGELMMRKIDEAPTVDTGKCCRCQYEPLTWKNKLLDISIAIVYTVLGFALGLVLCKYSLPFLRWLRCL